VIESWRRPWPPALVSSRGARWPTLWAALPTVCCFVVVGTAAFASGDHDGTYEGTARITFLDTTSNAYAGCANNNVRVSI